MRADDMFNQVHGVVGQGIGALARNQVNDPCLNRPHVDATVGPLSEHDIETTACSTQVIARAQLAPSAFKRLLNEFSQVEVK